ncbi:MAG TPA: hypothetical protein VMG08_10405 [Allosphingosinicella sp.]|nr:hypothetical protein [Allosphingosinicella sp.]
MTHRKAAGAALALSLALAACGDTTPPTNEAAQAAVAVEGSDRLQALNPLNRRIGLLRAIQQSGFRCRGGVLTGAYQQRYQNLAMWVALCADGKNYAVFIAPTDDVQVRDCTEHAQLNLPACRPVPPLPRDPQTPANAEPDTNLINAANANLAGE